MPTPESPAASTRHDSSVSAEDRDAPLCIGFGEREGRCLNDAGSTHSQIWCQECDDERRKHITEQLDRLEEFYRD